MVFTKQSDEASFPYPYHYMTDGEGAALLLSFLSRWGTHLCWEVGPSFPSAEVSSPLRGRVSSPVAVFSKGLAQYSMVPLTPVLIRAPDMDLGSSSGPESPYPSGSTGHPDQYGPCSNVAFGHHHYHLCRWESWPRSQEWENYLHPSLAASHWRADPAPAKAY